MKADDIKEIIPDYSRLGLTLGEARFVAEYLTNGFNATKAYMTAVNARCTRKYAGAKGAALLQKSETKQAISRYMAAWLGEKKEKLEVGIISVLWARAFYDPANFINPDGSPRFESWDQIPKDWRTAVDGIETKFYGKDADRSITTMKLADRERSLEKLARYISLFAADQVDHNLNMSAETENKLIRIFREAGPGAGVHLRQKGRKKATEGEA